MFLAIVAVVMSASPASAQQCRLPAGMSGWSHATDAAGGLAVGRASSITLASKAEFILPPVKAASPDTRGAVVPIEIARPGTYRVALGGPAWIDLVRDGKPIASTAHAHGDACTGIAKMVDFTLAPGRYTLQLSGAKQPAIKVLVARLP